MCNDLFHFHSISFKKNSFNTFVIDFHVNYSKYKIGNYGQDDLVQLAQCQCY